MSGSARDGSDMHSLTSSQRVKESRESARNHEVGLRPHRVDRLGDAGRGEEGQNAMLVSYVKG